MSAKPTGRNHGEKMRRSHSMIELTKEFTQNTSMHGLKFITQDRASFLERVLWIVLFGSGFFFAMFFSWKLWVNWEQSPVLITIQTANYPITNYPFPTVTVCSVNKVSTRALGEWMSYTKEAKTFKLDELRRILEILSTNRVDNEAEVAYLSHLLLKANITSKSGRYEHIVNAISPNCSDMILYCSWEDKEEDCSYLFETEATDDGYCCSFNSIILRRNGKHTNSSKQLRYARNSGVYAGLTVILDAELEDYNVTSSDSIGFKVSIQDPNDFARTGRIGFLASPGYQIDAAVTGQTQVSDDSLRVIKLDKRLCTTTNEITLEYFPDYTGPYCSLDCLTKLLLLECKCIPYYYPVAYDLPVCNLSSYPCLDRVSNVVINNSSACYCPDVCTTVWYRNEISSGIYPNSNTEYPATLSKRIDFRNMTAKEMTAYAKNNFVKLNVYFKTVSGLCYIMDERTTWADFISACGGLLGLGFGFSVLSAAELFYFLLIRWCYYYYYSNKNESRVVEVMPDHPFMTAHHANVFTQRLRKMQQKSTIKPSLAIESPPLYNTLRLNNYASNMQYRQHPFLDRSWVIS